MPDDTDKLKEARASVKVERGSYIDDQGYHAPPGDSGDETWEDDVPTVPDYEVSEGPEE